MKVIKKVSDLKKIRKGCILTIGNFDGVHLGHQEILTTAKKMAVRKQTELAAITFDPHPVAILQPERSPGVLTPLELKTCFLAELGVDRLFVLKSTRRLLSLSPQDFIERFLVKNIQPSVVVEGQDFNFGFRRGGNISTLQKLGDEKGFLVSVVKARKIKLSTGETLRVSSTMVRNLLESGRVADAAVALSRPYRLIGQVVPGHGKGRQLGFPTANLQPLRQIIPAEGVYAGFVEIGETIEQVCKSRKKLQAALSIGTAQTLGTDRPRLVEAHLLMENVGELIGKWLAMDFIKHLRNQMKFASEKELSAQIAKDCKKAKEILATNEHRFR